MICPRIISDNQRPITLVFTTMASFYIHVIKARSCLLEGWIDIMSYNSYDIFANDTSNLSSLFSFELDLYELLNLSNIEKIIKKKKFRKRNKNKLFL